MAAGLKKLNLIVIVAVFLPLLTCWATERCYLSLYSGEETLLISSDYPSENTPDLSHSPDDCLCLTCQTFIVNAFVSSLHSPFDCKEGLVHTSKILLSLYCSEIFHPPLA
jgi:hypothetical protein